MKKRKIPRPEANPRTPAVGITALIGGGIGLAITLLTALISPFALLSLGDPNSMVMIAAAFCLFVGGLVGSAFAAKRCKNAPVLSGLLSAAVMALPLPVVSFFVPGEGSGVRVAVMILSLAASAVSGSFLMARSSTNRKRSMKRALKRR